MKIAVLNTAIKLKSLAPPAIIEAILYRVQLSKNLFIINVEKLKPTKVPIDLNQDNIPYSMRYYDPIIAIIQEGASGDTRNRFCSLMNSAFEKFEQYNSYAIAWHTFVNGGSSKKAIAGAKI